MKIVSQYRLSSNSCGLNFNETVSNSLGLNTALAVTLVVVSLKIKDLCHAVSIPP